jgi:4-hydroxy-3-methylbut-2-enyl diphosphate reductase
MAGEVDAVVVVGGKNSGNTRRLAEISSNYGIPTYHVESEEELKPELFSKMSVVGVTGGVSTPDWTIRRVVEKLHRIKGHNEHTLFRGFENLLRFACFSGLFTSLSALGLLLAASVLAGAETSPTIFLISALFVFFQQTVFNLSNMERILFINPLRGEFIKRTRLLLKILAGAACAMALLLSLKLGIAATLMLTFAFALGITYLLNKPHGNLSDTAAKAIIPLNHPKGGEITTSISWSLALGAVPAIAAGTYFLPSLLATLSIFLAALLRFILLNTRDFQADKMLGRMTLPVRLNEKRTEGLIYKLIVILASLSAGAAAAGIFPALGYLFAALPFYLLAPFKLRKANAFYPDHLFLASLDAFMLLYLALALFSIVV